MPKKTAKKNLKKTKKQTTKKRSAYPYTSPILPLHIEVKIYKEFISPTKGLKITENDMQRFLQFVAWVYQEGKLSNLHTIH